LQKGGSLLMCLWLAYAYDRLDSPTMMTYAALHGSYGLLWLLKEAVFPDPNWQVAVTLPSAVNAWLFVLGPYWLAPYLIASRAVEAPAWKCGAATMMYSIGVVLMMGADAQKYFVLRARRGLITDGFFARVRHTNYLGEMMLYGSFAWLSCQPEPWYVVGFVWGFVFVPNMLRKEARMSRYPEWAAYCKKAGFLWPKFL